MSSSTRTLKSHSNRSSQQSPDCRTTPKTTSHKKKRKGKKKSKSTDSSQIQEESDETFSFEPEENMEIENMAAPINHDNSTQNVQNVHTSLTPPTCCGDSKQWMDVFTKLNAMLSLYVTTNL